MKQGIRTENAPAYQNIFPNLSEKNMKELNEKKEFIRGQCRRGGEREKDRFEGSLVFFLSFLF
jgi:hypothetical protein